MQNLKKQAAQIREFLIHSIADTGGHLASNLGVVELTLALHAVFKTPHDKIIWDVGHQAYVHKILTGRKEKFADLRKMDGLSGFPKPEESPHDAFGTGHSSTAISAALGLALARDLRMREGIEFKSERLRAPRSALARNAPPAEERRSIANVEISPLQGGERIVAVVGDGSITGGLAYEGLNNAGRSKTDLLVVLNDNQMSISRNVGAISRHLNELRTASVYLGAKKSVHNVLDNLPIIGKPIAAGIEFAKDRLKYALIHGVLFEELGFNYIGPVDGHDLSALLAVLRQVKHMKGPVLLHVLTKKGKGYKKAENSPISYHGVGKFNVKTGEQTKKPAQPTFTDIFSKEICRLAARDPKIVAITAAMPDGTGLSRFKEKFPTRFFDVGIAESHAVTFAAGLAKGGLKPVFAVYSSFLQRAYDQIIHDVAIQRLPVIFAIDHAGAVSGDGETHQGIFDIAYLSHVPNMTILAPSSGPQLQEMLAFALSHNAPVAIRYPKDFAPLEENPLQNTKKIAIVSVGSMLQTAREAAAFFPEGEAPSVYDARFIKPINPALLSDLAAYDFVFSLEDGIRAGGFGESIRADYAFAFPDIFPQTATRQELFTRYGLDAASIYKKILEVTANGKQKNP